MPVNKPQEDQITTIKGTKTKKGKPKYIRQHTLQYKTFVKRAIAEAIQDAFKEHPDKSLAKTKVGIEYPTDRIDYPAVLIKFYERDIKNIGVGHEEWGPSPNDPNYPNGPFTLFVKYYHRIYHGDLEFEVFAESAADRDKVTDALIEVIAMQDAAPESQNFINRIYNSMGKTPYSEFHFLVINTDLINGYGEQQMLAPWFAEDVLLYQTSYRVPMMGEFYSLTPTSVSGTGLVEEVDIYPYDWDDPRDIRPEDFPEGIVPDNKYIKIRKRSKVKEEEVETHHGLETSTTLETSETLETEE